MKRELFLVIFKHYAFFHRQLSKKDSNRIALERFRRSVRETMKKRTAEEADQEKAKDNKLIGEEKREVGSVSIWHRQVPPC